MKEMLCLSEKLCHMTSQTGAASLLHSALGALTPPPTAADIRNVKTFLGCVWKAVDNWRFYKTKTKKKIKKKSTKCEKLQATLL